ncbi:RNA degradosome polyphosphate kinase [Ornithinibacillus massiliensis]|uniref:Polyphosphate kinase n=1 Tax=Ornithinibacillus massiliensis TaxID=1944633 RepID=A0ABS5MEZ2_9BACI|nr:RNA degradosome polyphosphate kinase [Ornithinibacillus massiliensis]MBS3680854.1 RNA degradosome polyphosphate kinase [Ornithinibacillus massiliensis]
MEVAEKTINLDNPSYYNNRELSWLNFNYRVLEEALDDRNALLERLKFMAIFSSNLDEFFMVRVAGLLDQVKAGYNRPENKAGLTPMEQLEAISKVCHGLISEQDETYLTLLTPLLAKEQISFVSIEELSKMEIEFLEQQFNEHIFPVLTPMAVDAYRPFPMLLNKSLNLAITIVDKQKDKMETERLAIVQVPSVIDRYIELPNQNGVRSFVLLEQVISHFIHKLFVGYQVVSVTAFRITRNADLTIHEDGAEDLLQEIEEELKKRKRGAAVRLEVQDHFYDQQVIDYLIEELEIDKKDVYFVKAPLDLTFLFAFYKTIKSTHEHLTDPSYIPQPPQDLRGDKELFEAILEEDLLLHHPYESFEPVVDFVSQAADDPDVLAIKQTLYRVSGNSPIIKSLERAAENGKQVTVLVELKARFDEKNNVQWAKELEKAGCHVIYGITHLKTHSKITLIVRRKKNQIERFVHLGTGNYNDATARTYTDLGLLTANEEIGIDATNFFNYLSGYMDKPDYHHLVMSPFDIREKFVQLIDEEIAYHKQFGNGHIMAKMNSLSDKDLIRKLYEASNAGIKVDLIVRGICCLRPGIANVSENIKVRSIVGPFLEHTRIYYFHHNGEQKVYSSSADMMTRNMEKRIEILFPILKKHLKQRVLEWMYLMLADNVKAREQDSTGKYYYVARLEDEAEINSQLELCEHARNFEHIKDSKQANKGKFDVLNYFPFKQISKMYHKSK